MKTTPVEPILTNKRGILYKPPSKESLALRDLRVSLKLNLVDASKAFGIRIADCSSLEWSRLSCDWEEAGERLRVYKPPERQRF